MEDTRPDWKSSIAEGLAVASYFVGLPLMLIGGGTILFGLAFSIGQGLKESISDAPGIPLFFVAFVIGCVLVGWPSLLGKLEATRSGRSSLGTFRSEIVFAVVIVAALSVYAFNVSQMDAEDSLDGLGGIVQVAAFGNHALAVRSDGTVVAVGPGFSSNYDVSKWTGIKQVAAGLEHSVGLRSNGTVVAVGENEWGQCEVSEWNDIVQVAAGERFTIGLRSDGTAVAVGYYGWAEPTVSEWTNVVQIAAGGNHAVGLRSDGTVVVDTDNNAAKSAAGNEDSSADRVSGWSGITQVSAGYDYTVGLRSDGTVVKTDEQDFGNEGWVVEAERQSDIPSWSDVVQVSALCGGDTVALLTNGTVVACGKDTKQKTIGWRWPDVTRVVSTQDGPIGLDSDGTVVVGDYASAEEVETEEEINIREYGFVPRNQTIRWDEAKDHIGETVTVEAVVVEVANHTFEGGMITYLNMGNAYSKKSKNRFQAIIWARDTDTAGGPVNVELTFPAVVEGKTMQITGEVKDYKGVPEIEISRNSQVRIADDSWDSLGYNDR